MLLVYIGGCFLFIFCFIFCFFFFFLFFFFFSSRRRHTRWNCDWSSDVCSSDLEVIDFDRVFIETTGLADPVPVLHTMQTDGMLGAQYRLDCVVTLVDAVNGLQNLDNTPEAAKQAAVADRIVITKSDIAPPAAVAALEERLQRMNPYAARAVAINGEVDVAFLRDV